MINVIGVRFRPAGKVYFFDPAGMDIKTGDHVIVETAAALNLAMWCWAAGLWTSPR